MTDQHCHEALKNKLLAAIPAEEFARLQTELEPVRYSLGETVYEPGESMNYIYFPTTSMISMLYTTGDGTTAEIGIHGNDGVVGLAVFLGGDSMPHHALVIHPGTAYRMKAHAVHAEFARGGVFQLLLLRFTLSLITQISQTAVCNRLHSIEQNLCRWLLNSHDRMQSDSLKMTHELIAKMIGVRRESVSLATKKLQNENIISYVRGTIKILDRSGLETRVCECYAVARQSYEDLIGG